MNDCCIGKYRPSSAPFLHRVYKPSQSVSNLEVRHCFSASVEACTRILYLRILLLPSGCRFGGHVTAHRITGLTAARHVKYSLLPTRGRTHLAHDFDHHTPCRVFFHLLRRPATPIPYLEAPVRAPKDGVEDEAADQFKRETSLRLQQWTWTQLGAFYREILPGRGRGIKRRHDQGTRAYDHGFEVAECVYFPSLKHRQTNSSGN